MTLSEAQIEARRRGVGSSDVPSIIGLSPFKRTATRVYCEKLSLVEREPPTEDMAAGHWMEPLIVQRFARETGRVVTAPRANFPNAVEDTVSHLHHDWALATPDALTCVEPGETVGTLALVEAKNVGGQFARDWPDAPAVNGVPAHVLAQVQWQMFVTGAEHAWVAALIAGSKFRVYPVERDEELVQLLFRACERFWRQHVLAGVPPEDAAPEDVSAYLLAKYPTVARPVMLPGTGAADVAARRLAKVVRAQERLAALRAEAENALKAEIGDALGVFGPGYSATWGARRGVVSWKKAAEAAGVTEAAAEEFRGKPSRTFTFEVK